MNTTTLWLWLMPGASPNPHTPEARWVGGLSPGAAEPPAHRRALRACPPRCVKLSCAWLSDDAQTAFRRLPGAVCWCASVELPGGPGELPGAPMSCACQHKIGFQAFRRGEVADRRPSGCQELRCVVPASIQPVFECFVDARWPDGSNVLCLCSKRGPSK